MKKPKASSPGSRGPTRLKAVPAAQVDPALLPNADVLMHELDVHRIELELQNQELRRAREEREAMLARYTELFDFAPLGYVTLDSHQCVREINHAGARILGRPRSQLTGKDFLQHLQRESRGAFLELVDRAFTLGSTHAADLSRELFTQGGVQVRVTANAVMTYQPVILMAFEDVTQQKAREARLERTERDLRDADRRKDEFIATLSHELRNPLTPIRTGLYVMAHTEPGDAQSRKAQAVIERQVAHLSRLVDDLLDLTRVNHGKVQLKREPVELSELLHATVDDHRPSFQLRRIRLEHHFQGAALWAQADPARLIQIISNLLGNAEKFTPEGGRVTVELTRQGDEAEIRVKDTGAGISAALIEQLFEPFAQAPQTIDRTRGGLGLGLATVKGLVELHGGTVTLQSAGADQGTEVIVRLPLQPMPAGQVSESRRPSVQLLRILVIEDNLDAAESLQDALCLGGHSVEIASDGVSGLALARRFHPEVVICDIGLKGMDGYEVARAFRAEQALSATYLVALTGYAQPEDVQRATLAGFNRHLSKPTDLDVLYQAIEQPLLPAVLSPPAPVG